VTAVDMGQQIRTVLSQIASEVIGTDFETIEIITGDTELMPEGIGAASQRQTYISGNAVLEASRKFKEKIISSVSGLQGEGNYEIKGNRVVWNGGELSLKNLSQLLGKRHQEIAVSATYTANPPTR